MIKIPHDIQYNQPLIMFKNKQFFTSLLTSRKRSWKTLEIVEVSSKFQGENSSFKFHKAFVMRKPSIMFYNKQFFS